MAESALFARPLCLIPALSGSDGVLLLIKPRCADREQVRFLEKLLARDETSNLFRLTCDVQSLRYSLGFDLTRAGRLSQHT